MLRKLKKGDDIHVIGQITQNRWINDEGIKRQSVSIVPDFIADKRQHPEQDYNTALFLSVSFLSVCLFDTFIF